MTVQGTPNAWLELSDDAPQDSVRLLQRMAIRDRDIKGERAQATLNAVGINASLSTCNFVLNDTRRVLRALASAELLADDFERRRNRTFLDFEERRRRKRKQR